MSSIVFLVIGCCFIVPKIDASLQSTVFLKTTGAVDIKALKNVAGVSTVYRVKPLYFYSVDEKGEELNRKWNYIVVGKDLKDAEAQNKFISDVGSMDFVKLHTGYRLSDHPQFSTEMVNGLMKVYIAPHFFKFLRTCQKFQRKISEEIILPC